MGRAALLRTLIVAALIVSAAAVHGECVSQLREASSGVFNRTATAVAWSGTTLGVAKVDESGGRAISFATYSEDLTQLTDDRILTGTTFLGVTALLWNGSELGLFYENATAKQLILQRVSVNGSPIGAPVPIATNHQPSSDREYDVVWDPTRQAYLVANTVSDGMDKGLWLTFVNRDGTTRAEQVITVFLASPSSPRVAVNASGTVVVLFRRSGMFNAQVADASGATGNIRAVMAANEVRIASNGTDFAVVGSVPSTGAAKELDWAMIDSAGTVSATSKLVSARGAEIAPVSLYWNSTLSEWALTDLDSLFGFSQIAGEYRLRRFTGSRTLISDSPFSPDPLETRLSTRQPFAWTGSSYVSAASRTASASTQPASFVIRHCPLTPIIDTPTQFVRVVTPVTFTARTDGGAGGETYSWDFSDTGETRSGQTVTHQYTRTGDFTVTLRVTDSSGATSVTTSDIHVVTPRRRTARH